MTSFRILSTHCVSFAVPRFHKNVFCIVVYESFKRDRKNAQVSVTFPWKLISLISAICIVNDQYMDFLLPFLKDPGALS